MDKISNTTASHVLCYSWSVLIGMIDLLCSFFSGFKYHESYIVGGGWNDELSF